MKKVWVPKSLVGTAEGGEEVEGIVESFSDKEVETVAATNCNEGGEAWFDSGVQIETEKDEISGMIQRPGSDGPMAAPILWEIIAGSSPVLGEIIAGSSGFPSLGALDIDNIDSVRNRGAQPRFGQIQTAPGLPTAASQELLGFATGDGNPGLAAHSQETRGSQPQVFLIQLQFKGLLQEALLVGGGAGSMVFEVGAGDQAAKEDAGEGQGAEVNNLLVPPPGDRLEVNLILDSQMEETGKRGELTKRKQTKPTLPIPRRSPRVVGNLHIV